jgi:hypothetical protein
MVKWQSQQFTIVPEIGRQSEKTIGQESTWKQLVVTDCQFQLPQACLDCNFPSGRMTDVLFVPRVFDGRPRRCANRCTPSQNQRKA